VVAGGTPALRRSRRGFTLIEVVVAVGVFAVGIVAVLGLLSPVSRSVAAVADRDKAAQLGDAIQTELARLRDSQTATASLTKLDVFAALVPAGGTLNLVASRDGAHAIRESDAGNDTVTGSPPGIAKRDRYFLVVVSRQPSPLGDYTDGSGFLALTLTVKWPYQIATGAGADDATAADLTQASVLILNTALSP
jgi:prepilin-type N-terminal cleavage/methylation domain-containing protein